MIICFDLTHCLKGVTLCNDNGSQFIANKVRHYLRHFKGNKEFTHIAFLNKSLTMILSMVYFKERSVKALTLNVL